MGTRSKRRSDRASVPGRVPGLKQRMLHWERRRGYVAGPRPVKFADALEDLLGEKRKHPLHDFVADMKSEVAVEVQLANFKAAHAERFVSRHVRAARLARAQAKPRVPKKVRPRVERRAAAREAAKLARRGA